MSGRSGGRDKKGAKEKPSATQTSKNTEKLDLSATKAPQATPEQLRLAQIIHDPKRTDIPNIENIIQEIHNATGREEDDISVALHDNNFDVNKAVMALLEGSEQGEWKTSTKKTRKPPAQPQQSASSQPTEAESTDSKPPEADSGGGDKENKPENYSNRPMRERPSNNFRGPPRLRRGGGGGGGGGGSGGGSSGDKRWKSRERQENEKNLAESGERGRGRGRGRRDRGQRGRGPRMFQNTQRFDNTEFPKSIDTWNNNQITVDNFTATPWDESVATSTTEEVWDAEEWDGAIESKVFTPSTAQASDVPPPDHSTLSSVLGSSVSESIQSGIDLSSILQKSSQSTHASSESYLSKPSAQDVFNSQATESLKAAIGVGQNSQSNSSFVSNSTYASSSREFSNSGYSNSSGYSGAYGSSSQYSAMHSDYAASSTSGTPQQPSYSSPSTPQTNYSTTTTTQQPVSYTSSTPVSYTSATAPVSYSSPATPPASYSSSSVSTVPSQSSSRKNKPSKIPSEAVEMPHDSMGELGMKLEGLAFGTATTFNDISEPTFSSSSSSCTTVTTSTTSPVSTYSASTSTLTQHLSAALSQSTKVSGGDSSISSSFTSQNSTESKVERSTPSFAGTSTSPKTSVPTESLSSFNVTQSGSTNFHSSYSSQKSSAYHSAAAAASTYITQTPSSSSTNYTGGSSSSSFSSGSYPSSQQQSSVSSSHYPSTQTSSSSYSGGVAYSQSTPTYSTTYQSGSNSGSTYQGTTQPQIYHSNANHYAAATYSGGLATNQYSASGYGVAQAPNQSAGTLHPSKLNALTNVKDPQFDSTVSTTSQGAGGMTASSAFAFPTSGSTQTTKSITPTSKTGSIPNVPAGIPTPLMGTHPPFVVGQTTAGYHLAAFPQVQQPQVVFDDLVLQQRIPIAANSRDTNMAAYSVNDGVSGVKFGGRSVGAVPDTNTSSPGQTSTAQTQHQFIGHIPPFYYYPTAMVPGNYPQYGTTPAVYPVNNVAVPPASNTGVSNTQFQKTVTAAGPFVQYNSYGENTEYSKAKSNLSHTPAQQASNDISSVYRTKSLDKTPYGGMGTPPPGAAYGSTAQYPPMFIQAAIPNHQQLMHLPTDSSSGTTQRATGTGQSSKPNAKQGYPFGGSWS